MIDKFKATFRQNLPMLQLWGEEVVAQIKSALVSHKIDADIFLKITGKRVKDENSALSKLVRKNYTDPLTQMTDLVGTRFVVLLTSDLNILQEIIENNEIWDASKDKDYLDAIEESPELFDYQSIHYVVRSKIATRTEELGIPEGLACEIQIRTLLQHAYAELTHDNVYKPTIPKVPFQARRLIARSMALMESTDELFCKTIVELEKVIEVRNNLYKRILETYNATINSPKNIDFQFNVELLDCYQDKFNNESIEEIISFITDKTHYYPKIKARLENSYLNQQPVVFFVYWLISLNARGFQKSWPYNSLDVDIDNIYSDLGIARSPLTH
jgi:putative GTP pyrophosphokinase